MVRGAASQADKSRKGGGEWPIGTRTLSLALEQDEDLWEPSAPGREWGAGRGWGAARGPEHTEPSFAGAA